MVEDVEKLRVKFQSEPFGQLEVFCDVEIEARLKRPAKLIPPGCAKGGFPGVAETRRSSSHRGAARRNAVLPWSNQRDCKCVRIEECVVWVYTQSALCLSSLGVEPRRKRHDGIGNKVVAAELKAGDGTRKIHHAEGLAALGNGDPADRPAVQNPAGKTLGVNNVGKLIDVGDG